MRPDDDDIEKCRFLLLRRFGSMGLGEKSEDLAHEVLLRAWQQLEDGAEVPRETLPNYCMGIARNLRHEEIREILRAPLSQDSVPEPSVPSHADQTISRVDVTNILNKLDPASRDLLSGYFSRDRKEFAAELHLSNTALRVRISRIMTEIRQGLGLDFKKRSKPETTLPQTT